MYQVNREQVKGNDFWSRKAAKGLAGFLNPVHKDRLKESGKEGVLVFGEEDSAHLDEVKAMIRRVHEYVEAKREKIKESARKIVVAEFKRIKEQLRPNKTFEGLDIYVDILNLEAGKKSILICINQEESGILEEYDPFVVRKDERDIKYKLDEHFWADMLLNRKSPFFEEALVDGVVEKEAIDALGRACEKLLSGDAKTKSFLKGVVKKLK